MTSTYCPFCVVRLLANVMLELCQMCRQGVNVLLTTVTVPVYNLYFIVTHRFWILGLLTLRIFQIHIHLNECECYKFNTANNNVAIKHSVSYLVVFDVKLL